MKRYNSSNFPFRRENSHPNRRVEQIGQSHGEITEAEYFRILAGILSHPVDLEIDKLLSSL
jgi:hypothetical protein